MVPPFDEAIYKQACPSLSKIKSTLRVLIRLWVRIEVLRYWFDVSLITALYARLRVLGWETRRQKRTPGRYTRGMRGGFVREN